MTVVSRTDRTARTGEDTVSEAAPGVNLNAVADQMLARWLEDFHLGRHTAQVTTKDLQIVLAIKEKFGDPSGSEDDLAVIADQYGILFSILGSILSPDQQTEFGKQLASFPVLRGIRVRSELQERKYRERVRAEVIAELTSESEADDGR